MKKILAAALSLAMLLSLAACGGAEGENKNEVSPVAVECDMTSLGTSDWSASIDPAYVENNGGNWQMQVNLYSMDLYTEEDVSRLKEGMTFYAEGGALEVTSVAAGENGSVLINGGTEEGGYELVASDTAGLYRISGMDDAATYTLGGILAMNIASDVALYDDSNPEEGQKIYVGGNEIGEVLTDFLHTFTERNTTVHFEDGRLTAIHNVYIP